MKRLKKSYIKNLILPAVLIAAMFTNVCAADVEFEDVYNEDFSDASATAGTVVSNDGYIGTAQVKDGAVVMQSDSLVYWKAHGEGKYRDEASWNPNTTVAHAIKLNASSKNQTPIATNESNKATYSNANYYGDVNQYALWNEEVDGLRGMGSIRVCKYKNGSSSGLANTEIYFDIDDKIAAKLGSNVTFKMKVYLRGDASNPTFSYSNTDGGVTNVRLKNVDENVPTNQWYEFTHSVTNADLTGIINSKGNIKFLRNNDAIDGDAFIHSIEVYPTTPAANTSETSVTYPISDDAVARDVKAEFDLTIPAEESIVASCANAELSGTAVCSGAAKFNAKDTVMYASLLDGDKLEGVKLKYVVGAEGALSVYACTADGDVLINTDAAMTVDTAYNYLVTVDYETGAYDVEIKDGEDTVASGTAYAGLLGGEPFATQYLSFKQSLATTGAKAIIDNIKVEREVSADYIACRDAAATLTLPEVVSDSFDLTTYNEDYGTDIAWTSDITAAISVDGDRAIVIRSGDDQVVKLTATVTKGVEEFVKNFDVTVKGLAGTATEVTASAEISGGKVIASATVTAPGISGATSIKLVVMAIDSTGKITARGEATQAVPANPYEQMVFTDVVSDPDYGTANAGDNIVCYVWDEKGRPLTNNAPVIENFKVSDKASGAVITWDAYDDYDAAEGFDIYRGSEKIGTVVKDGDNFLPSATENYFSNEVTYRKINGTWKLVSGTESAQVAANSYKFVDQNIAEGVEYTYSIVPRDTNQLVGEKVEKDENNEFFTGKKIAMPYYNTPGSTQASLDADSNGISMMYNTKETGENYSTYFDGMTDNGVSVSGRWIDSTRASGRVMAFKISGVEANDAIVVRHRIYLDKAATVKISYNASTGTATADTYYNGPSIDIKPNNGVLSTGQWIYVNTILEDTNFGGFSGKFSNGHFGFYVPYKEQTAKIYLYKVEAAKLTDWE